MLKLFLRLLMRCNTEDFQETKSLLEFILKFYFEDTVPNIYLNLLHVHVRLNIGKPPRYRLQRSAKSCVNFWANRPTSCSSIMSTGGPQIVTLRQTINNSTGKKQPLDI